ncbi:MAG: DUF29 domain-containing protein [Pseudomonadota bacterium]
MSEFATVTPDIDVDYVVWMERQIDLIRERQFSLLDVENLVGELRYIVSKERRAPKSRLIVLIAHLLKCQFQPMLKTRSWRRTLFMQRSKIEDILENSPSMAREVMSHARSEYGKALRLARYETNLDVSTFPPDLPYTEAQLLDFDFVP